MKKVYQSRIDKNHGTCMQAAIASLFEMFIEDVPNFIEMGDEWWYNLRKFYKERGYLVGCYSPIGKIDTAKKALEFDGGINGYWFASVESVNLGKDVWHAVIIDKDLNVVHDPNPNNYGHVYKPEDILSIDVCKDNWHIGLDGNLVIEDKE